MQRILFPLTLTALVCSTLPARAELPPLIPRKVLFGNPVKMAAQVSPDGRQISFVAPDDKDVLHVWVQTLGKEDARKVTADKRRGIRIHDWTYQPEPLGEGEYWRGAGRIGRRIRYSRFQYH